MPLQEKLLFNFAASYSGGGYKRLHEYARWFNANGGAAFVIHPASSALRHLFPHNRYFPVQQSRMARVFDDWGYLDGIIREIGRPDLYYAYGIPLYRRVGRVNWFHLSNVLTLDARGIPLSPVHRLKFLYLGWRIRRGLATADVVSAESRHSLQLLESAGVRDPFLSVNGSDDELAPLAETQGERRENIAIAVGTYSYKALADCYCVFRSLQQRNPGLQLHIIGEPQWVPGALRGKQDVLRLGLLERPAVLERLRRARYYISTTLIENSFNNASEGAFLAAESYVSDIGPHRELLAGERFEAVNFTGARLPLLHVRRADLRGVALKSWHQVVVDMLTRASDPLGAAAMAPSEASPISLAAAGHDI